VSRASGYKILQQYALFKMQQARQNSPC